MEINTCHDAIATKHALNGLTRQLRMVMTQKFQTILNNMMEAFAVLIVTTCIIPIVVLVIFLWLVKTALNVDMNLRLPMPRKRL